MARWDNARNGDLYRNMIEKIKAAGGVRAILWYQGCADADAKNAAQYAESFARMVKDTRRDLGEEIPFFTMQPNRYETQPDAASWGIKEIQRRSALTLEKVHILPNAGLPLSDEIHNSSAGNVTLGQMLARQVHGTLNGGLPFEAPDIKNVQLENGNIRLSFRHVSAFTRLRPLHDAADFCLTDDLGKNEIQSVSVQEKDLLLTTARSVQGKGYLSYGAHPQGPEGAIVNQQTYLPIISFDHVEVSK